MSEYLGVICVPKELLEEDEELREALDLQDNLSWDHILDRAGQYVNIWVKKGFGGILDSVCSYEDELAYDIDDFAGLIREGKPAIIGVTKKDWDYFVKLVKKSEKDLGRQWFTWNDGEAIDEYNPFEPYYGVPFLGIGNVHFFEVLPSMGFYNYDTSKSTLKKNIYKTIFLIKNRANNEYLNALTNLTFSNLKELKEILEEKYDIEIHQINFEKKLTKDKSIDFEEVLNIQCILSDLNKFIEDGWLLERELSSTDTNKVIIYLRKYNIILWDIWQIQAN